MHKEKAAKEKTVTYQGERFETNLSPMIFRRNQPCQHTDLGPPASRTGRHILELLRMPSCAVLLPQPWETNTSEHLPTLLSILS